MVKSKGVGNRPVCKVPLLPEEGKGWSFFIACGNRKKVTTIAQVKFDPNYEWRDLVNGPDGKWRSTGVLIQKGAWKCYFPRRRKRNRINICISAEQAEGLIETCYGKIYTHNEMREWDIETRQCLRRV